MIEAFHGEGKSVQPTKAGPDFIDPSHHEAVAGVPSRTLSTCGFRAGPASGGTTGGVTATSVSSRAWMGMYDGDGSSTAMVAEALDLPVVLVVDAKAGWRASRRRPWDSGVRRDGRPGRRRRRRRRPALPRRASRAGIRDALPDGIEFLGRIPPQSGLEIPDRHLGLAMGDESPVDADALASAAESLDVSALLDVGREPPEPGPVQPGPVTEARVAVAQDEAFCFTYAATLERLRERAEVVAFSPVAGDDLPGRRDLPPRWVSGTPRRGAGRIAGARHAREPGRRRPPGVRRVRRDDGPGRVADDVGRRHLRDGRHLAGGGRDSRPVPGAGSRRTGRVAGQPRRLAGRQTRVTSFTTPGPRSIPDATFAFDVERGSGIDDARDGLLEYRTLGTYCHCHPASGAFDQFLERV